MGSIRNVAANENYRIFIRAMTICQIAVRGLNNTLIKNIKKTDYGIIDRLCKHEQIDGEYKDYKNAFPDYVNKVFKSFTESQISLAFSFDYCKKYIGILKVFGFVDQKGLLKFDYLCKTFKNCENIVVLESASNAQKVKPFTIPFTASFADKLLIICDKINEIKNIKIESIVYRFNVELSTNEKMQEYYIEKFNKKQWSLILRKEKSVRGLEIKNREYTLTLRRGQTIRKNIRHGKKNQKRNKRKNQKRRRNYDGKSKYYGKSKYHGRSKSISLYRD